MRTNSDCTVYARSINAATRAEAWTPYQVREVMWQASSGAKVLPNGTIKDDKATIYIPFERGALDLREDYVIVRGLVDDEIGASFTMTDLRRKYPDVLTIRRVTPRNFGAARLHHWEIAAS